MNKIMESSQKKLSVEEVTDLGRKYYFEVLQERLEITNSGNYLVLEPLSKKTFIDPDLTKAIQQARLEYPDTLFYIVQIGQLHKPTVNKVSYAWSF